MSGDIRSITERRKGKRDERRVIRGKAVRQGFLTAVRQVSLAKR